MRVIPRESHESKFNSESGKDGCEIEGAIRDMEGEKAWLREFAEVELHGFERHEVHGDGVCAEGI